MRIPHRSLSLRPLFIAALVAAGAIGRPASAVQLQVTQIPFLSGTTAAEAMSANSKGQVTGYGLVAGVPRAWYWSGATGTLEIASSRYGSTFAWAVNESGTVLGNGLTANNAFEAFTWQAGTGLRLLGNDGRVLGDARGFNNAGTVVGSSAVIVDSAFPAAVLYAQDTRAVPIGSLARGVSATANAVNDIGTVVGTGSATGNTGGRAFIWDASGGIRALEVPAGTMYSGAVGVNSRNDVVGSVVGSDGLSRAALWQGGSGAPLLLTSPGSSTIGYGLNDAGQVVGTMGNSNGTSGTFLWSRAGGVIDANTLLAPASNTTLAALRSITAEGVIVGSATDGHAVMLTPTGTLRWQGVSGGSFGDMASWEHGFAPSRFVDVVVAGPSMQTVTMGADTTVKSLVIGGGPGQPTVALQHGARLMSLSGQVLVESGGTLAGDGRITGSVLNRGTVQPAHLRIDGGLTNQGVLTGSGRIDANVANSGAIRVGAGQTLVVAGPTALTSTGRVELHGGELETRGSFINAAGGRLSLDGGAVLRALEGLTNRGSMEFGFGSSTVYGTVVTASGARVVVSGTGQALFNDGMEVQAGGELRVASGSQALFYGMVLQRNGALMTGTGTKFYEGGLAIGNSPGTASDEGSIAFGASNVYEAEIGLHGHDHLSVGGELQFGGVLKLIAWDGFAAQAGQRFDLFDWGTTTGTFDTIDDTGLDLSAGLVVDTSRLYMDGSIAITAVPEPAPGALLTLGMVVFALRRLTS